MCLFMSLLLICDTTNFCTEVIRKHTLRHSGKVFGAVATATTTIATTAASVAKSTGEQILNAITSTAVPTTTPSTSKCNLRTFVFRNNRIVCTMIINPSYYCMYVIKKTLD